MTGAWSMVLCCMLCGELWEPGERSVGQQGKRGGEGKGGVGCATDKREDGSSNRWQLQQANGCACPSLPEVPFTCKRICHSNVCSMLNKKRLSPPSGRHLLFATIPQG